MDSLFTNPELVQAEVARLMQTGEGLLAGTAGSLSYIPYATQVSEDRLEETVSTVARTVSGSTSAHYCEQGERVIRLLRDISAPAIELIAMPCNFNVAKSNDDQSRVIAGPPEGYNDCFSLLVIPVYPMSRGSTHITKASPGQDWQTAAPEIDLSLLSHPSEVDVMAAGLTTADRAFKTSHMAGRVGRRVSPPIEVNLEDVSQARKFVQESVIIINHNIGTCAMGRVVDDQLRVKGVSNLRVVDCSVIPDQISAHTMATVYALAERAAHLISQTV